MVDQLEAALDQLVRVAREGGLPVADKEPGAGAAGALAWGLRVFAGAQLKRGFDVVSEALGLFSLLNDCDLVITGEGRLDTQSPYFKGPYALGRLARMQHKKSVLFAGAVGGPTALVRDAFDEVIAVGTGPAPSRQDAPKLLQAAVFRWALRQSR
jgi:glycerate kinase